MRKGINTSKDTPIAINSCEHRIIIPLYIPHELDYYEQSFRIFELTIQSLKITSTYNYQLSVISDNCCESVNGKLYQLFQENSIDELILEKENIGKINAILKVLRTTEETYVTIADADVLFLNHWDKEVFAIFNKFPKAAAVSPTPIFRNQMNFTANIWVDYLFSDKLKFRNVKNPMALEKFAQSLGWNSLEPRFKDVIMTLESQDKSTIAVVGATHFAATYNIKYLKNIPKQNTNFQLGGSSEGLYLDKPPFDLDGYRLSTYDNFAYHIGNTLENYIEQEFSNLDAIENKSEIITRVIKNPKKPKLKAIAEKLLLKFISNRKNYNRILKQKGLTQQQLDNFWY